MLISSEFLPHFEILNRNERIYFLTVLADYQTPLCSLNAETFHLLSWEGKGRKGSFGL